MLREATVLALLVTASHVPAAAQPRLLPAQEEPAGTPSDVDPFAEADALASTASALYATGAVLRLGGAGGAVTGALGAFSCWLGHGTDCDGWLAVLIVGAIASTVGLVLVFVGVSTDIDSGRRRRAAQRDIEIREIREPPLSLRLTPMASPGRVGVVASGSF